MPRCHISTVRRLAFRWMVFQASYEAKEIRATFRSAKYGWYYPFGLPTRSITRLHRRSVRCSPRGHFASVSKDLGSADIVGRTTATGRHRGSRDARYCASHRLRGVPSRAQAIHRQLLTRHAVRGPPEWRAAETRSTESPITTARHAQCAMAYRPIG